MASDTKRAQEGTIGFECNQCTRTNATDLTCGLIARVMLHPGKDGTEVEVVSNVGNMVAITLSEQQNAAQEGVFQNPIKVVAGARYLLCRNLKRHISATGDLLVQRLRARHADSPR